MSLRCTAAAKCDAHRVGDAPPGEKCAWYCDAPGCRRKALVEARSGRSYCRTHAPRAGHPRTTGSKGTAPIQFRVGAADRAALERIGAETGESAGQVAHRLTLQALDQNDR